MASKSRKKSINNGRKIAVFDPGPSGTFAAEVLKLSKANGILVGRLAVWAWLEDTSGHAYTKDLDIAVSQEDLLKIRKVLAGQNIKIRELPIGGINVSVPGNINVDFITRAEKTTDLSLLFEDAVKDAVESNYTVDIEKTTLVLASVEHLIAMKIATMERKDEEDAERLLTFSKVNTEKLRQIVFDFLRPLGPARLENILRQAGHPGARPKGIYNGK